MNKERRIIVGSNNIDYEHCTIRAKVTVDSIEYSAFYDACNLVLRDKNAKVAHLDEDIEEEIMSKLDDYLGIY